MKKEALNIDYPSVAKSILGGLMVGGGTAAGLNLIKQLKWLKERRDGFEDTSGDDNTIFVDLPRLQSKEAASSDTVGAQITAAVLSALLGWGGVNKLTTGYRNKQLQQELDNAQVAHVDLLNKKKNFGKSANLFQNIGGTAKGSALLMLLGSAVLTNQFMSHYFKDKKPSNSKSLSRVKFRTPSMEKEIPTTGNPIAEKEASISADAAEIYARMGLVYASKKASDLRNIVTCAAYEGVDGVKSMFEKAGNYDSFADYCAVQYENHKTTPGEKYASIVMLSQDEDTRELMCRAASFEHTDATANSFSKVASNLEADEEVANCLMSAYDSLASLQKQASLRPLAEALVKQGFFDPSVLFALGSSAMRGMDKKDDDVDATAKAELPASDVLIDTSIAASDTDDNVDTAEILDDTDFIDSFIADNKQTILDVIQQKKEIHPTT